MTEHLKDGDALRIVELVTSDNTAHKLARGGDFFLSAMKRRNIADTTPAGASDMNTEDRLTCTADRAVAERAQLTKHRYQKYLMGSRLVRIEDTR